MENKKLYQILVNGTLIAVTPSDDPVAMLQYLKEQNPGVGIIVTEKFVAR